MTRCSLRTWAASTAALLCWTAALADQGGVPFWLSGQFASLAAVPATPGWSLPTTLYAYSGSAGASKTFTRGEALAAGLGTRELLMMFQPTYAPDGKLFGGQPALALGFGYGLNRAEADLTVLSGGAEIDRSDSVWGWSDLTPYVEVAWNHGVHNWMAYITGNIPVGSYDSERLANIGIGHGAIDGGGGYTYLDAKTGRELSVVLGFTYNFENTSTDYKNGIDSHIDWGASQFFSGNWEVGIAGYAYSQLTGDSGSGARLGSFKSRIAGAGPQIGKFFNVGDQQWYASVRGYWEFWAANRVEGWALFATLNIPLSTPKR